MATAVRWPEAICGLWGCLNKGAMVAEDQDLPYRVDYALYCPADEHSRATPAARHGASPIPHTIS